MALSNGSVELSLGAPDGGRHENEPPRLKRMMSDGWNVEVTRMVVNYVIVVVSDMKRSVAFYRDTIGLPMKFESPGWTEFATDGATIALHPGEISGGKSTRPSGDQAGQCRPGLGVPDLDLFHRKMVEQGVPCVQEPTNVFGSRVAQYADPDGLAISVGEEKRPMTGLAV